MKQLQHLLPVDLIDGKITTIPLVLFPPFITLHNTITGTKHYLSLSLSLCFFSWITHLYNTMESLSSSSSSSFACHMTTVSNSSDHSSSASTCCSSRSSCSRRRVSFREVEIIELPMTVGDGPSLGVPLTVDWQPQDRSTFDIDFFEQFRPERRNKLQLRMGPESRERL